MNDLSLVQLPDQFWEDWASFSSNPIELAWASFFTQASDLADAISFSIQDQNSVAMVRLVVTAPGVLKIQLPSDETFDIQRLDDDGTGLSGAGITSEDGSEAWYQIDNAGIYLVGVTKSGTNSDGYSISFELDTSNYELIEGDGWSYFGETEDGSFKGYGTYTSATGKQTSSYFDGTSYSGFTKTVDGDSVSAFYQFSTPGDLNGLFFWSPRAGDVYLVSYVAGDPVGPRAAKIGESFRVAESGADGSLVGKMYSNESLGNEIIYQGEFSSRFGPEGTGQFVYLDHPEFSSYQGQFFDSQPHGTGTLEYQNGLTVTGEFYEGNAIPSGGVYGFESRQSVRYVPVEEPLDQSEHTGILDSTYWDLSEKTFYYSFANSESELFDYDDVDEAGLDLLAFPDWLQEIIRNIFDNFEHYIDVEFVEIPYVAPTERQPPDGIINFIAVSYETSPLPDAAGWAIAPSVEQANSGEIWLNTEDWTLENSFSGTFHYRTIIHEIGHMLGLKHPWEPRLNSNREEIPGSIASLDLDTMTRTVMSYNSLSNSYEATGNIEAFVVNTPALSDKRAYPSQLMDLDIKALQELYGANTETGWGDQIYEFSDTSPPLHTIFDNGGFDTLDLSGLSGDSELYFTSDRVSKVGPNNLFSNQSGTATSEGLISFVGPTIIEKVLFSKGDSSLLESSFQDCEIYLSDEGKAAVSSNGSTWVYNLNSNAPIWSTGAYARFENSTESNFEQLVSLGGNYLRHSLAVNGLAESDQIIGTDLGDTIFLSDLIPNSDHELWDDATSLGKTERLFGIEMISTGSGNDLIDMTSAKTLVTKQMQILAGEGDDIVWLNNGDYEVDLGDGSNQLVIQNGVAVVTAGNGANIVRVVGNDAKITASGFGSDDVFYIYQDAEISGLDQSVQVVEIV